MLKKGQIIKNYKELCEIMSWKVSAGDSKKAQLKELEKLCEYHKEGNKFVIDKVYRKPREKTSSSDYIQSIQNIILNLIAKNKSDTLIISSYKLYELCDMINPNYSKDKRKISEVLDVNIGIVFDVCQILNGINLNGITRALNGLANKSLIVYSKQLYCKYNGENFEDKPHEVLSIMASPILRHQRKLLKKYGFKKLTDLYYCLSEEKIENRRAFNDEMKEYLLNDFDITEIFYAWKIYYDDEGVLKELGKRELQKNKTQVNKDTLSKAKNRIKSRDIDIYEDLCCDDIKELINCGIYTLEEVREFVKYKLSYSEKIRMEENYNKNADKVATVLISNNTKVHI